MARNEIYMNTSRKCGKKEKNMNVIQKYVNYNPYAEIRMLKIDYSVTSKSDFVDRDGDVENDNNDVDVEKGLMYCFL